MNTQKILHILDIIGLHCTRIFVGFLTAIGVLYFLLEFACLFGKPGWEEVSGALYMVTYLLLMVFLFLSMLDKMKYYLYKRFLWVSAVCLVGTFFIYSSVCYWEIPDQDNLPNLIEYKVPKWMGGETIASASMRDGYYPSPAKTLLSYEGRRQFPGFTFCWPTMALFIFIFFPGVIQRRKQLSAQSRTSSQSCAYKSRDDENKST